MATYAELQAEPFWDMETIPPNLRILVEKLQRHYGLGWNAIGCKGDNRHLRGAHRSRRWIRSSRYCTNRTYTVSRTPGDRSGGDDDWLAGVDATLRREDLIPACKRLDEAVRAGKLEKITEWYGNDDGDNRVDGYDNIANRVATSDDSHLWHLHLTFDRGMANQDHTDVYEILTGVDMDTRQNARLMNTAEITGSWAKGKMTADNILDDKGNPVGPIDISGMYKAVANQVIADLVEGGYVVPPGGAVLVPHTHDEGATGPAVPTES